MDIDSRSTGRPLPVAELVRQRVERALAERGCQADAAQRRAIEALAGWLARILHSRRWRRPPPAGVYLWGGVGRGKSFVMDRFFEAAPVARKRRVHFHAFLLEVQARMGDFAGQPDPLRRLARALAGEVQLLCFDEFHVHDIGDARLLGRLLEGLIEAGVGLVCTSNYPPPGLCPNPLYRERFEPTIALIEARFEVLEVDAGEDYRLRRQASREWGCYRFPAAAGDWLPAERPGLLRDQVRQVHHRALHLAAVEEGRAWLAFDQLFRQPRASQDMLWLCRHFAELDVGVLPRLEREGTDVLQRFVNFVDIAYDAGTRLNLHAEAPPGEVVNAEAHPDLQRTLSRLAELRVLVLPA